MRSLILILFLSSMALGDVFYTKERIIIVQNRREFEVHNGRTFFRADTYTLWQADFFRDFICGRWLKEFDLWDFNQFARVYVPIATPWVQLGITKEQYEDWLACGELRTQSEIRAAKEAEKLKQIATAVAQISNIKFYLSSDGKWHTDKDCLDCVNAIEINPFDVMKIPNVKQCEKCGVR